MSFMSSWPYPLTLAALFVIVMLRANATYWLGRGVRAGADRTKASKLLSRRGYRRAESLVNRYGAPAVTVCFMTVGVQTMINMAAGVTRMPLRRYLPAVTLGSVIWAFIYATVGFVTIDALVVLWQQSPLLCIAVIVLGVAALAAFILVVGRSRTDLIDEEETGPPSGDATSSDGGH